MKNAAAISAQVVDIQNDRMHKGSIKITLHVPAEAGAQLTEALGWPTYTQPVPVALARLEPGASAPAREAESVRNDPAPNAPASRLHTPVAPEKRLAQRAGMICSDRIFWRYLNETIFMDQKFCTSESKVIAKVETEDHAADVLRWVCAVKSRSEIIPGTDAATRFDELYSKFIGWRDADIYVEQA